jgi:hypothetical protein
MKLTQALESYVRRAQRGSEDAAMLTGSGKDLLEAAAAHVLVEITTLLGQALISLGLKTSQDAIYRASRLSTECNVACSKRRSP